MEIAIGMSMVRNGSFQMVNELTEMMAMECWMVQIGFLWLWSVGWCNWFSLAGRFIGVACACCDP